MDDFEFGFADSDGVRIHFATIGTGPLVVMIHGFPDFWYTWRHQMRGLASNYRVVAMDLRGYNHSDQPQQQDQYAMHLLMSDVAAVIRHFGERDAAIVGHDWGAAITWNVALHLPDITRLMVAMNMPHPFCMANAWATSDAARAGTGYAKVFREGNASDPDIFFGMPMRPETLSGWVTDEDAAEHYREAFARSNFDGMLNCYKENYPDIWGDTPLTPPDLTPVTMPALVIHGLADKAVHADGLNRLWECAAKDLTLVTVPGADHFVQQDAAKLVTRTLRDWLDARH
ncbi:MAG: alpha/beta hydrolase [Pseudomonadota bacterium]